MSCVSGRGLLGVAASRSIDIGQQKSQYDYVRQRRIRYVAVKAGSGSSKIEDGGSAVRSIRLVTHRSTNCVVRTIETLHHRAHLPLAHSPAPRLILELLEASKGEHMLVRRRGEDDRRGRRRRRGGSCRGEQAGDEVEAWINEGRGGVLGNQATRLEKVCCVRENEHKEVIRGQAQAIQSQEEILALTAFPSFQVSQAFQPSHDVLLHHGSQPVRRRLEDLP